MALLLMAHALAMRVATGPKRGKPDLDAYLAAFAKVDKALKATTATTATGDSGLVA